MGRAVAQPVGEPVERLARAPGEHPDAAVGEVLGHAVENELAGACTRRRAERDSLHAALDQPLAGLGGAFVVHAEDPRLEGADRQGTGVATISPETK